MAGSIPAERGQDVSPTGIAPQETSVTQVEYKPFSELTPDQIAQATGGIVQATERIKSKFISEPNVAFIKYPGLSYLNWQSGYYDWDSNPRRDGRLSSVVIDGRAGPSGMEFGLDNTVAIVDKTKPGITFVDLLGFDRDQTTPVYDWLTIENGEMTFRRRVEGSDEVTAEIRTAAIMARELKVQKDAAEINVAKSEGMSAASTTEANKPAGTLTVFEVGV